jgi:glycerol-1-phosphate dehydrogenase [NAD(P)+]
LNVISKIDAVQVKRILKPVRHALAPCVPGQGTHLDRALQMSQHNQLPDIKLLPRYLRCHTTARQAINEIMTAILLDHLLRGTLPDPDSAGMLSISTRSVVIADSLRGAAAELLTSIGFGRRLLVIDDATTRPILGERVTAELSERFSVEELVLDGRPYADLETVEMIEARLAASGSHALVAVGSGTINDLCKYAGYRRKIPYAVFATAPSMNGYSSVTAAITIEGHKTSVPASAAAGIFADLTVLAGAPRRMIQAGFGDSICRSSAQADWLLAHLLLDQPYRKAPYALLHEDEAALMADPANLLRGEPGAIEVLMRNLILSGFGMTICGGSHPASQGEHLISHYLEMLPPAGWSPAFHGEQVAIATLTMARLQEAMLLRAVPFMRPTALREHDFTAHFGAELGRSCWQGFSAKIANADHLRQLNSRLAGKWPAIQAAVNAIRRSPAEIRQALTQAGAPTLPQDIGLSIADYRRAVLHAREIRDRFTFLDLAADSGCLSDFVAVEPQMARL